MHFLHFQKNACIYDENARISDENAHISEKNVHIKGAHFPYEKYMHFHQNAHIFVHFHENACIFTETSFLS